MSKFSLSGSVGQYLKNWNPDEPAYINCRNIHLLNGYNNTIEDCAPIRKRKGGGVA